MASIPSILYQGNTVPQATVVPTDPGTLLLAVVAQIAADQSGNFTQDNVFAWQSDEELPYDCLGDCYAWVTLGAGGPDGKWEDGMGRVFPKIDRKMTVTIRSRLIPFTSPHETRPG